ncbi:MAG: RodZ domain-containing protein [Acidiferrobacterales bacterium]
MSDTSSATAAIDAGPGKRLCDAREKSQLSREQVAEMLRLSPQQIVAIENDDFENLPGPTYVRGYLRSYAQVVGLSADDVIASYARVNGTYRSSRLDKLAPEPQVTMRDGAVQLATFLVASVLIILAVVWWQGRDETAVTKPLSAQTGQALGEAETEPLPAVGVDKEPEALTETKPSAAEGDQTPGLGTVVNVEEAAMQPRPASAIADEPPAALSGANVETTAGSTDKELIVQTNDASWVDIRDARNNRLLYTLLPAGRRVSLVGAPPFRVFLGNPDGVKLEFEGEQLDASVFKRGVVARFTLGGAE